MKFSSNCFKPRPSNLFPNSVLMELHMLINTKVLDHRKKPEPDLSFQKSKSTPTTLDLLSLVSSSLKKEKRKSTEQSSKIFSNYICSFNFVYKQIFLSILSSMSHKNSQFKFFDPKLITHTLNHTFFFKKGHKILYQWILIETPIKKSKSRRNKIGKNICLRLKLILAQ